MRRIWRGWSVPVGGATPDRHQARAAQLVREWHREGGNAEGIGGPIVSGRERFGGGGAFRSGVQPPTGTRPDRLSWFGSGIGREGTVEGIGCPIVSGRGGLGGGGAFRSGVQPPTGTRPDRLSWFGSGIGRGGTVEGIGCPIVSGRGDLAGVERSGRGCNPRPAPGPTGSAGSGAA